MPDPQQTELADAYFDNRLDAMGGRALEEALANDASFRRWFAQQCHREVALRMALRVQSEDVATDRHPWRDVPRRRPRQSRRRRNSLLWAAGLAAAVLIAALGVLGLRNDGAAVELAAGIGVQATDGRNLPIGARLAAGTCLKTKHGATLRFITSKASLEMSAACAATVHNDGMILDYGHIDASLPHLIPPATFHIRTPHALVTVIGTRFSVTCDAICTLVEVQQGVVEVSSADQVHRLHPGESGIWPPTTPALHPAASNQPAITGIRLCLAPETTPLLTLNDGSVIDLAAVANRPVALVVTAIKACHSVRILVTDTHGTAVSRRLSPLEQVRPFTFPGDRDGEVAEQWSLQPGSYTVAATAYADLNGQEPLGAPVTMRFIVVDRHRTSD